MFDFFVDQIIDSSLATVMSEIEATSGAPVPWSVKLYQNEFENQHVRSFGVYKKNSTELVGFIIFQVVLGEADVSNFVVKKDYQSVGVGSFLLKEALKFLKKEAVVRVSLEVRSKNFNAQRVYEKNGFTLVGKRKGYYKDSGEDAFLMDLVF